MDLFVLYVEPVLARDFFWVWPSGYLSLTPLQTFKPNFPQDDLIKASLFVRFQEVERKVHILTSQLPHLKSCLHGKALFKEYKSVAIAGLN